MSSTTSYDVEARHTYDDESNTGFTFNFGGWNNVSPHQSGVMLPREKNVSPVEKRTKPTDLTDGHIKTFPIDAALDDDNASTYAAAASEAVDDNPASVDDYDNRPRSTSESSLSSAESSPYHSRESLVLRAFDYKGCDTSIKWISSTKAEEAMKGGEIDAPLKDDWTMENGSNLEQQLKKEASIDENSKSNKQSLKEEKDEKCFTVRCAWRRHQLLYINPRTYLFSYIVIWGVVIWSVVEPKQSNKYLATIAKSWVTDVWTWLYISTQVVWVVTIIMLMLSKYGNWKLGKPGDKPQYNNLTYLSMCYSCGVGTGYIYYAVAEPIWHYTGTNRYKGRYNDNVRAQDAINVTLFHWGFHGWVAYCTIGILLAYLVHRRGMPMTMRMLFYPIIGSRVYGIIGDLVDSLSIICTMFGVCTSLGLGVRQINAGISLLAPSIPMDMNVQVIIVWCISVLATISVISGINWGIRRWSEICFALGWLFILVILFADETWFLLSLITQSVGYYFQHITQLAFHTDAFAQLGIAPDKNEKPDWMDGWTIFYWGWWISWGPFVSVFIAKISKGRTIREFVTYTLIIPCAQCCIWFCVFGGSGIRMENLAINRGMNCSMYDAAIDNSRYASKRAELFARYNTTMLSCRSKENMWFDVMYSYGDLGKFLSIVSLIMIVLGFTTSSDSASLAIDVISANGREDPPVIQRIFWSATEGALATALLVAGGQNSLGALQAVSVICGLPFTFVMNWTCISIWKVFRAEERGVKIEDMPTWVCSVWDLNSTRRIKMSLISIFCPWLPLTNIRMKLDKTTSVVYRILYTLYYGVPFYVWIGCLIGSAWVRGLSYVGWASLMFFFAFAHTIRWQLRQMYDIDGDLGEDIFSFLLMYPLTCMQISEQYLYPDSPKPLKDVDGIL